MDSLPIELKFWILLQLDYDQISQCRLVCQEFDQIIRNKYFICKYIQLHTYHKTEIINDSNYNDFPKCKYQVHTSYLGNKKHGIEQWNRMEGGVPMGIYKLIPWKNGLRSGEERIYIGSEYLSSVNNWYLGKKEGESLNFDPFNEGKLIQRFFYRNNIKEYEFHYTVNGDVGLFIKWNSDGKHYYTGSYASRGRYNLILAVYAGDLENLNAPRYDKISKWFQHKKYSDLITNQSLLSNIASLSSK